MFTTIYLIKVNTSVGAMNMTAYADEEAALKALEKCKQWETETRKYQIERITLFL